jgi:hypothetical protein
MKPHGDEPSGQRHLLQMSRSTRWRALDEVIREYFSFLMNDVPPELIEALRQRLEERENKEAAR